MLVLETAAQGVIGNGDRLSGTIAPAGEADSWTFNASAGSAVVLRVGSTNFSPRIRLFDGANALVAEATSGSSFTRDLFLRASATNAGTYTVLVSGSIATGTGGYALALAMAPAAFTVSTGDEGGVLQSGASNPGVLALGDLDLWSFEAKAGDALILRMGAPGFAPWILLYGPDGKVAAEVKSGSSFTRDVFLSIAAPATGHYTVVASGTVSGDVGPYTIQLARVPDNIVVTTGDEGGPLRNGANHAATNSLGDLDVWSFPARAGDSFMLRMGSSAFAPWLRLYDPNGVLAGEAKSGSSFTRDVQIIGTATNSGTYTVVSSGTVAGDAGKYNLHLAQVPEDFEVSAGDEGGVLRNGVESPGVIEVGDLDLWSFTAKQGDALVLRMGATDFAPRFRLYGPSGNLVGEATSGSSFTRDVSLEATAPSAGTYTVVACSAVAGASGPYRLSLVKVPGEFETSPGDDGGELRNGADTAAELTVGDLDVWTFEAKAGDEVMLRLGADNFAPTLQLYDPNGALAGAAVSGSSFTRDVSIVSSATNAGSYTVVVSSAVAGAASPYHLFLAQSPESFIVPPGDEGGPLANGATNNAALTLGDLDLWSFVGTVGDSNVFRVTATNFAPWLRLYGPTGSLVGEARPTSSFIRTASLIYELTNNPGSYTLVLSAGVAGQVGGYNLKQSRWAPDLNVPADREINEGETLSVAITAQDPDEPAKPLQFALLSGPPGAIFALGGATNATITWATTEADGPSTNVFVAKVTDVVGTCSFSRTNSFAVIVREVNLAPHLTVPATQSINELTPLALSASATDEDIPLNPLTFSLVAPPDGLTINPATGAIAWLPGEGQGPSTNVVTVVVTDDSPYAVNATHLSDTNRFTVIVREVNTPPALTVPGPQTIDELTPLSATASATDADLPANQLTFSLLAPPPGLTIHPTTGAIAWTPTEAQGPSTNVVTVIVSDDSPDAANEKRMAATNSFTVVVREVNTAPTLVVTGSQTIDELTSLNVSASATDADLPANPLTFSLLAPPVGMTIDASSGAIAWTPTEAQGPSTNIVTVVVADTSPSAVNAKQLSATNSFTVVVREANLAPTLPIQPDRVINELVSLVVTNTAADADLPANTLTYLLVAPPAGATISAAGVITWTPSEAQGPSTNVFTTIVSDDAVPALTATNVFKVVVNEVNLAPVLTPIADTSIHYGFLFNVGAVATDADLPAQTLAYRLAAAPANATIDAASGVISWTPRQDQLGLATLTVVVTDNGSPALSATNTFHLTVSGNDSRLAITALSSGLIQISTTAETGQDYELQVSTNLLQWKAARQFKLLTSPDLYIDPESFTAPLRYYRLKLVQR